VAGWALDLRGAPMNARRLYLAVALCAALVYVGSLWNGFALDDTAIILGNPLMRSANGIWEAFAQPYWPPDLGGKMYRPIPLASFVVDALLHSRAWFHVMNVLWHAGATIGVAALARRMADDRTALAAGLLFAVHPVHVEAVANIVGRAELMATLFATLSVYAALVSRQPLWCAVALAAGLLSKENAAVVPALVAWGWLLGIDRPPRRVILSMVVGWAVVAVAYAAIRWAVLHPYLRFDAVAPVFSSISPVAIRLTAVAALADVARLLVFPDHLRVEYTPLERTAVATALDGRFALGLVALLVYLALLVIAWRKGHKVAAFGLGWIGIAYLPVANLLFPSGVLIAERTLYLPSVGFALAAGSLLSLFRPRVYAGTLALITVAGGARSALRVPVWRDDRTVTVSILDDSPRSYRGPARAGSMLQSARRPEQALEAYRVAIAAFPHDVTIYMAAADAAFTLGQPRLADSMLQTANRLCFRCAGGLRVEARAARSRGDSATADSLEARARLWEQQ
jgi:hypothetical protein